MKMKILTAIIVFWSTGAFAHTALETTTPARDAVLTQAPTELVLGFKSDIRLTRLRMIDADDMTTDLDLDGFGGFTTDYVLPVQSVGAGAYVIEWRGLGADGHVLNGSFSFTVE